MTVKQYFDSVKDGELAKAVYEQLEDVEPSYECLGMPVENDMTFGQMTELRRGLTEGMTDFDISQLIGRVMGDKDVSTCDYLQWLPYMLRVLKYVTNSIKNEEQKLKYTPTSDEKAAGIEKLGVFKEWGIVDALVRSRPAYKHADIFALKYTDVFLMQWIDLEHSKFERKLIKIQQKNNKQ